MNNQRTTRISPWPTLTIVRQFRSGLQLKVLSLWLLLFTVNAVENDEWEGQINDAFRRAKQQAGGIKGSGAAEANRYIDQAEQMWNQAKAQYAKQQGIMQRQRENMLKQQQQMLKNQKIFSPNQKNLQTINPFSDYLFHGISIRPEDGRLHGPGTIADDPNLSNLFNKQNSPGKKILDETNQIQNSQKHPASFPKMNQGGISSSVPKSKWDNPIGPSFKDILRESYKLY